MVGSVASHFLTTFQVLPEWETSTASSAKTRGETELERLQAFFEEQVEEDQIAKKKAKLANPLEAEKLERKANRDFLLAVDHQLRRGAGLSLRRFVVEHLLRALTADEEILFHQEMCQDID